MKYLLFISYIGTSFHGVQRNKPHIIDGKTVHLKTVLGEIELAWKKIFPTRKDQALFFQSSRTDTDVHALRSAIHVWFPEDKYPHEPIAGRTITKKLNKYFEEENHDLRIIDTLHVSEFFCSRKSAISRTYLYRLGVQISDSKNCLTVPMSEWKRAYFFRTEKFDVEKIKEATQLFIGEKDHYAVMGKPSHKNEFQTTIRHITTLDFKPGKPLMPDYDPYCHDFSYYDVICTARSFLYRQVRRVVSVLIAVGLGRMNLDDVKLLFDKPEPSSWNSKAFVPPGYGLYLLNVAFKEEDLVRKSNIVNVESKKDVPSKEKYLVGKSNIVSPGSKKSIAFKEKELVRKSNMIIAESQKIAA